MDDRKIILTSRGLNCKIGREAIKKALRQCIGEEYYDVLSDKSIMLCTMKEYGINGVLEDVVLSMGFVKENIVVWDEQISSEEKAKFDVFSFCYIGEGNTFQIAQMLRITGADSIIEKSVAEGGYYIGLSAGAMLAASSIRFASDFDSNFVRLTDFGGFDLLSKSLGKSVIIPHYNKKQFWRWRKNTPAYMLDQFNYIDYIPDTKYKLF